MLRACAQGDADEVARLLALQPLSALARSEAGETAAHVAAREGQAAVLEILLGNGTAAGGADPCARTHPDLRTPLLVAVYGGHRAAVAVLLARTEALHAQDASGASALHAAIACGEADIAEMVLAAAVAEGEEAVRTAVASRTWAGAIPLHAAALQGAAEVVTTLVDAAAGVDGALVEEMLAGRTKGGATALMLAVLAGSTHAVDVLLTAGSDKMVAMRAKESGANALHFAAVCGDATIFAALLRRAPGLASSYSRHGLTPVHVAAAHGHHQLVAVLVDELDGDELATVLAQPGLTPEDVARLFGKEQVIRALDEAA
ncbi:uncharacterized protein AMSG_07803 [Thecamonas trahens ATCC 50062]|uniref:Uncharacterized protein n=1 Tax=Thecamonas trahens ATCC 50062 TaxID=461836 RepID=A0A0L0DH98_THETB|nr:hypothetical protein AMSG_07803 [Thecamonas trahens ATCC 50062]KNC51734.1 hypothetical protein AMSG_07803 [Thecamonas trahens ATCC 50062]|eukprot:XP_013755862.1 hypothetical protein AMSG_07803 [Thecamonas trahens ATCC 50062]